MGYAGWAFLLFALVSFWVLFLGLLLAILHRLEDWAKP